MAVRVFQYSEIVAGSNYAPLTLELRSAATGYSIDLTGATVTLTLVDETSNEVIVQDGSATQNADNPYWVEYYLSDETVAKITAPSAWLAQWTVTAGNGRKHKAIGRVPVRPGVL